jgi:hypothetical protein
LSRLLFFLLLVANLAFGLHVWLSAGAAAPDLSKRERNAEQARIVAVVPPATAAQQAERTRQQVQSLSGAACVEFAGFSAEELPRAREALAAMQLGDRLAERKVEEVTRHWVFVPPARDRRAAEQTIATLRKLGVNDLSLRPDQSISLGVFSTEEAARRHLAMLDAKGVKGAQVGPFARESKDTMFVVRDPDSELVSRLALLARDHAASTLRAVPCPAPEPAPATAAKK